MPAGATEEVASLGPDSPMSLAAAPAVSPPAESDGATSYFTLDQLKAEMQKLVWTKGDFRIVPYGTLWANYVFETHRTTPGDFTFYVAPNRPNEEQQSYVNVRSTRLGIDLSGPKIDWLGGATTGGKVEIDFQRNVDTENRPALLLRHAYIEVKNDDYRLLAGQTWDVISPLYPGMLMYSVGWDGGNIGYRRAQFRAERYLDLSDVAKLTFQGSINDDNIAVVDTGLAGVASMHAGWPLVEGRTALTLGERGPGCFPVEIGVSGHLGEEIFDFSTAPIEKGIGRRTWSANLDSRSR